MCQTCGAVPGSHFAVKGHTWLHPSCYIQSMRPLYSGCSNDRRGISGVHTHLGAGQPVQQIHWILELKERRDEPLSVVRLEGCVAILQQLVEELTELCGVACKQ